MRPVESEVVETLGVFVIPEMTKKAKQSNRVEKNKKVEFTTNKSIKEIQKKTAEKKTSKKHVELRIK